MLTVDDANEAKCERKPEMNHPAVSVAFFFFFWCVRARARVLVCVCVCVCAPTSSQPFTQCKARCDTLPPLSQTANCI